MNSFGSQEISMNGTHLQQKYFLTFGLQSNQIHQAAKPLLLLNEGVQQ